MKTASLHGLLICSACSWLLGAPPSEARFLQVDPVGYEDQINLYAYVSNDPVNRVDPTGTHGRGPGFSNDQWRRFNRAQIAIASQLEGGARRINRAIERGGNALQGERRRFERQFGPGTGTDANMRAVAGRMSTTAGALRDDGTNGYWAEGRTGAQFQAQGRGPDVAAYVADDRPRTIIMNVDHGAFGEPARLRLVVGHDGGHTVGMRDAVIDRVTAYRFGQPNQREAYRLLPIRDSNAAMNNPDAILEYSE